MVHLSEHLTSGLSVIAAEVIESTEHDSHTVEAGLNNNRVFRDSRHVASAMERAIIKDAVPRGASRARMITQPVTGGLDIVSFDQLVQRHFRVKSAKRRADGTLDVVCGAGSSLLKPPAQEPGLMKVEQWVFGVVVGDDHEVADIFVAEVRGSWGESIKHLKFGPVVPLTPTPTPDGFVSDPEDLDGFDDDLGDETGTE